MRRARIKAVASVPVRRRAQQSNEEANQGKTGAELQDAVKSESEPSTVLKSETTPENGKTEAETQNPTTYETIPQNPSNLESKSEIKSNSATKIEKEVVGELEVENKSSLEEKSESLAKNTPVSSETKIPESPVCKDEEKPQKNELISTEVPKQNSNSENKSRALPRIISVEVRHTSPQKVSRVEANEGVTETSEGLEKKGYQSGGENPTKVNPSTPTLQKPAEAVRPTTLFDTTVPRRPRLFSESSDTKGHLSGSEATSPTKLHPNRPNFTRPIPRLDGVSGRIRRNSVQGSGASASESEDDSRRQHQQPPLQTPNQTPGSQPSPHIQSKLNPKQKRKLMISESARKLAEARREFLLKHENKQPDRAKLTMYDLIYYNPSTNPMTQKRTSGAVVPVDEVEEEEVVEDEPEEEMPVPQLKVGPNGELVVDEQSLVVENTALKKGREAVAKRRVLVDEEGQTGGFYKKRTKSKDWTSVETLKFYKALNTVGTDFSLMHSVFPKRSRQELKMKFKKEERVNRWLVEKALKFHQEYDIEMLRQELEDFDRDQERIREEAKKERKSTGSYKRRIARKRMIVRSINMQSESEEDEEEGENRAPAEVEAAPVEKEQLAPETPAEKQSEVGAPAESVIETGESPKKPTAPKSIKRKRKQKKKEESDKSDESESEDDLEVYKAKPTRSGRQPKKVRVNAKKILDGIYNEKSDEEKEEMETEKVEMPMGESVESLQDVEAGSLVIYHKESPDEPGKTILEVYMVSKSIDGKVERTPIDLSSDIISSVHSGIVQHEVTPANITLD